jgi:hypothetical protein
MNTLTIVGISGPIKCGKSTAAAYLQSKYPNSHILSFASPLKKIIQELFLLSSEQLSDSTLKEMKDPRINSSPRELMQFFGTNIFRNKDLLRLQYSTQTLNEHEYPIFIQKNSETFWIWHLSERIKLIREQNQNKQTIIFVDDVRYEDEHFFLKNQYNAHFIYIDGTQKPNNHSSEQNHEYLKKNADVVIHNQKSLQDFYLYLDQIAIRK